MNRPKLPLIIREIITELGYIKFVSSLPTTRRIPPMRFSWKIIVKLAAMRFIAPGWRILASAVDLAG
jgi:hypothetical protein